MAGSDDKRCLAGDECELRRRAELVRMPDGEYVADFGQLRKQVVAIANEVAAVKKEVANNTSLAQQGVGKAKSNSEQLTLLREEIKPVLLMIEDAHMISQAANVVQRRAKWGTKWIGGAVGLYMMWYAGADSAKTLLHQIQSWMHR